MKKLSVFVILVNMGVYTFFEDTCFACPERMILNTSKKLKRRLASAFLALTVAFLAVVTATFAWYIYNTGAHTTNVHMAAGASVSLQISNKYEGTYGSAAVLDEFVGTLNPVSTNRIAGGFQKVFGFTNGSENQTNLVASLFGPGEASDYYQTSLFIRTNGETCKVYLSDIGFEDSDEKNPISTAIRVGLSVHRPGKNKAVSSEYIFQINEKKNPQAEYNTATGRQGYVLDASKRDGTTVDFEPYSSRNFCSYDKEAGVVSLKQDSVSLFTIKGNGDGEYGEPVQVDIYIWLEGCDEDCTNNLCSMTLRNLAVSFAGLTEEQ